MENKRHIAKWGFGMSPISSRMQGRYDLAVQTILAFFEEDFADSEVIRDALSELKGMFNRCYRKDQWDWFSVYTRFGEPNRNNIRQIVFLLSNLRSTMNSSNIAEIYRLKQELQKMHLLDYLHTFQHGGLNRRMDGISGWIYVLSTKQQPSLLKIGKTTRSVFQRVKEINAATGVVYPYSARAVFWVKNAEIAEKKVHALLGEFRVRKDREFFEVDFGVAIRKIEDLFSSNNP